MQIVEQKVELVEVSENATYLTEKIARTCYNSTHKMVCENKTPCAQEMGDPCGLCKERNERFIEGLISKGHAAMFEFGSMTVKCLTSRGISHELVRHRLCDFMQQSTRYINMREGIKVIKPFGVTVDETLGAYRDWETACAYAESSYFGMIDSGCASQIARDVLPTCLATEIYIKANFREWGHIFSLRLDKPAHPHMRQLMTMIYGFAYKAFPAFFGQYMGLYTDAVGHLGSN